MLKTRILAAWVCLSASMSAAAQASLHFCTAVEKDYCYFNNIQFITPLDSSRAHIFLMIKDAQGINTTGLVFHIFSIGKNGEESFLTRLSLDTQTDWTWAWKSYLFSTPGRYVVRVFSRDNRLLQSGSFELILPSR